MLFNSQYKVPSLQTVFNCTNKARPARTGSWRLKIIKKKKESCMVLVHSILTFYLAKYRKICIIIYRFFCISPDKTSRYCDWQYEKRGGMTPCFSYIRNSYSGQFPIETIPQNHRHLFHSKNICPLPLPYFKVNIYSFP